MNVFTEMAEAWIRENSAPAAIRQSPQEICNVPEYQPTEPTKHPFVSFDSSHLAHSERIDPHPTIPRHDPEAWREPVADWLESECVRHWRCHSSVTSLHQAYCEWDVSHGFPPCNCETFVELLRNSGFLILDKMVSGLIHRADFEGVRIYPEVDRLLCRELPAVGNREQADKHKAAAQRAPQPHQRARDVRFVGGKSTDQMSKPVSVSEVFP